MLIGLISLAAIITMCKNRSNSDVEEAPTSGSTDAATGKSETVVVVIQQPTAGSSPSKPGLAIPQPIRIVPVKPVSLVERTFLVKFLATASTMMETD